MTNILKPILRPLLQPVLRSPFEPVTGGGSGDPLLEAVLALYANGEQGALYYFTEDFAGLYQDAAGTTPVTAVGQPVGLMLDRRFGLARGVEQGSAILTHSPSNTREANGDGRWLFTAGGTTAFRAYNTDSLLTPGKSYAISFDVEAVSGLVTLRTFQSGGSNVGQLAVASVPSGSRETVEAVITLPVDGMRIGVEGNIAAGSTFILGETSIRELPGNHASQPTTTARPALLSGPPRIDYDGVDDYLRTVFPALGSNVTIARSIPGVGAQILTGQTIAAGDWDDNVDSCAALVIDRALTGPETALVTAFLNQQAGV